MYLSYKKEKLVLFVGFFFLLISVLNVFLSIYILCIIFIFTFVYIFVPLILNLFVMSNYQLNPNSKQVFVLPGDVITLEFKSVRSGFLILNFKPIECDNELLFVKDVKLKDSDLCPNEK